VAGKAKLIACASMFILLTCPTPMILVVPEDFDIDDDVMNKGHIYHGL
jgi:hypothetical protein